MLLQKNTYRMQNESECNVKKSSYFYYPKIAMSTMKDAAEYRKSWNFLGAFVPCKSSTKITVCPSVYPSACGKWLQTPWTNLHKILYLKSVPKFSEPFQFSYIYILDNINDHLTWPPAHISERVSLETRWIIMEEKIYFQKNWKRTHIHSLRVCSTKSGSVPIFPNLYTNVGQMWSCENITNSSVFD
jgi:hypothetical protein